MTSDWVANSGFVYLPVTSHDSKLQISIHHRTERLVRFEGTFANLKSIIMELVNFFFPVFNMRGTLYSKYLLSGNLVGVFPVTQEHMGYKGALGCTPPPHSKQLFYPHPGQSPRTS